MKFSELKVGMEIWRNRLDNLYADDEHFAHIERIAITGLGEEGYNAVWLTRQSVDVYGYVRDQGYENALAKEFAGGASGGDEMEMRQEQWDGSWSKEEWYNKRDIKRLVMMQFFEIRGSESW